MKSVNNSEVFVLLSKKSAIFLLISILVICFLTPGCSGTMESTIDNLFDADGKQDQDFPAEDTKVLLENVSSGATVDYSDFDGDNSVTSSDGELVKILLDDENTKIVAKELASAVKEILSEVETPEISTLHEYLSLSKKKEKDFFISQHPEIPWEELTNEKGTITKTAVTKYITSIQMQYPFPEESSEAMILRASKLLDEEKELKKQIKEDTQILIEQTKERMALLTDEECLSLLEKKWVLPLTEALEKMPAEIVGKLTEHQSGSPFCSQTFKLEFF